MHSSLIGKIQKAKRYAEERDRISFEEFHVRFRGDHDTYETSFKDGRWSCKCNFFGTWGTCSHTMAMQRILGVMIPAQEPMPLEPVPASEVVAV
jgi:hypothetical protein